MYRNLKSLRKDAGFTQESLAEASGVGASTIGNFETGRANMSDEMLRKIAEILNTTVDLLKESEGDFDHRRINESPPEYRTGGLAAIKRGTLEKLIDVARAEKDWRALAALANEIEKRTEES